MRFQDLFSSSFDALFVTAKLEAAGGTSQGIEYEWQINLEVLPFSISHVLPISGFLPFAELFY